MGLVACLLLGLSTWNSASAVVLTLLDWTTVPVPSGAHPDRYELPTELLFPSGKMIVMIAVDYQNLPQSSGGHPIQSTAFLFSPDDVLGTPVIENTAQRYRARVIFKPTSYLTDLSNPSAPAFVAMHGTGNSLTLLTWTATYTDNSTRTAYSGVIPEPGSSAFIAFSVSLGLFRRRVARRH